MNRLLTLWRIRASVLRQFINIMQQELIDNLADINQWAVLRIGELSDQENYDDSRALKNEFAEWLDPSKKDHDVISMTIKLKN
jgi:hypothetical protein